MGKFVKEKVIVTCENLKRLMQKTIEEIGGIKYTECGYKAPGEVATVDGSWLDFGRRDRINGYDKHFWFSFKVKTPERIENKEYALFFTSGREGEWDATNPQGLVYLNGKVKNGIDVNHRKVYLEPDTEYDVLLYIYTGTVEIDVLMQADLVLIDNKVKELYYDLKVPHDAARCFDDADYNHIKTIKYLEQACNFIDFRDYGSSEFYESVEKAIEYLKEEYYAKVCGNSDALVSYIGHTHIDVAWLWTLAQTREKAQRTFLSMLTLLDRYPDFVFMSSQPQLYEYFKEEQPEAYERIKKYVKEGRWEVEGAMWLEADCNLSSGESLVRQIFHGKKFMKDEFGVDSHILWLPDVFGYSAALPQILQKSGVDKFVTSKISWNEYNKMPYDSFMWQGIDGTEIFTYFLTAQTHEAYKDNANFATYNGNSDPTMNLGTWERYQQKAYSDETILTFGFGDGGGGTTEEMIETEKRLEYGLPGMPKAQMCYAGEALERIKESFDKNCKASKRTPKWVGELYLEFHRGTYTSMAKNKKNNRECEFLCQTTETLSAIDNKLCSGSYPHEELYKNWRTILLHQFHDIIPGSSIEQVYEDSDLEYAKIKKEVGNIKKEKLQKISENVADAGIFVYNPNSFEASGYVEVDGDMVYAENIPALGWKVIDNKRVDAKIIASKKGIESPHYEITFDDCMNIIKVFDKDNGREVIEEGKTANQLYAYEDYPRAFDNWEITNYYKEKKWAVNDVQDVEIIEGNGFGGVLITRKYQNSTITQKIVLYHDSRRIDFITNADWHEHYTLLRAHFPTTVHATKASYEVQFGNVERNNHENTSWDKAKFEVCAQKWGDLSEEGYGVSLLNNCKYGYSALENEIAITLIKCGKYPNENADQGIHEFTYSLYPHKDSFKQGGTIKEAYILNRPFEAVKTMGTGTLASEYSFISCNCENIIIETVKKAENGKGIIVRLYDSWNKKSNPVLKLGFLAEKISLCDMMENPLEEIGKGNTVELKVNNFEIITLLIE